MRRPKTGFRVQLLEGLRNARRNFKDVPARKTIHFARLIFLLAIRAKLKFRGSSRGRLDRPDHRLGRWLRQLGRIEEARAKRNRTRRLISRGRFGFPLSDWLWGRIALGLEMCAVFRFPGRNEFAKLVAFAARQ